MDVNPPSCILIGSERLLTECGEILLDKGFHIHGIIADNPRITSWCNSKKIPTCDSNDYLGFISDLEFDYLFSITHLEIISEEVLSLPKKMAINFHDGLLPRYAGLNTPVWALLNKEETYGITWHEMVVGVDEGDIIKEVSFPVSPQETSLSINTKCFAAGLDSFPILLEELTSDAIVRKSQNLDEKALYTRKMRPSGAGFLNWRLSGGELQAMVNALSFGEHPNPVTAAKLILDGTAYVVDELVLSENGTDTSEPGTILATSENTVTIACGDGNVVLRGLRDLKGQPVMLPDSSVGRQAHLLSDTDIECIDRKMSDLAVHERKHLRLLTELEPVTLGSVDAPSAGVEEQYKKLDIDNADVAISAFMLLVGKLAGKGSFDLALGCAVSDLDCPVEFASSCVPVRVNISKEQTVQQFQDTFRDDLLRTRKRGSFALDIIARTPALQHLSATGESLGLQVGLGFADDMSDLGLLAGTAITLAAGEQELGIYYDAARIEAAEVDMLVTRLGIVVENLAQNPNGIAAEINLLTDAERETLFQTWNDTWVETEIDQCVHTLFEQQVERQPSAIAAAYRNEEITFEALNSRANKVAHQLVAKGLQPDDLVGVFVERSIDLLVTILGVMKAGGAYLPLDPAFPSDRIEYMIDDSQTGFIVAQQETVEQLPDVDAEILILKNLLLDDDLSIDNPKTEVAGANLAYVIYTSGSTGKPKGVMVEHRNVCNFFVGMDEKVQYTLPATWLAVTSLSFDISVLELFWTITRGFKVVIYKPEVSGSEKLAQEIANKPMQFGLFMWGNDDAPGSKKYRLLLEGSKYFDENGFDSVWTPERHFHAFGGPYPNPSVTSAAIAAVTKNVKIRSGSIVSPLHSAIRIAEDWAVVDNLSDGRVGLSFAAGWQPNDFVIKPENHANSKGVMFEQIETVRKLWRGESVAFTNPLGDAVNVKTLPRPVQSELPVWVTTAGNPDSYRQAGSIGANVLTHLLGQSVEEVAEKVKVYREARAEAGFDPAEGQVSLMLHTFVGEDDDTVRELVREPMKDYLRSSMKLVVDFAWSFPAFKKPGGAESKAEDIDLGSLTEEENETILEFAFERYFETSGLFGTVETCADMINRCKAAGIDEIACLLDFGVDTDNVMASLPRLVQLRDKTNQRLVESEDSEERSFGQQIAQHSVTHLQCTPSMASMLCVDKDNHVGLKSLETVLIGGEAFPPGLAADLLQITPAKIINMYGPTETTIWSTTHQVDNSTSIPIGRPIANTEIFILDDNGSPVPPGTAGHLYIGGYGVVRGYFRRPELTEERFRSIAIDGQTKRLYWTGDLARYRADGIIEFLGRVDHQVKVRGHRIELGEIESILSLHPDVSECVVILREDEPGDQRLVGYFVTASQGADIAKLLKEHIRTSLPDYMVPNDLVRLDAMPMTPNRKIDRNALPRPSELQQTRVAEYVAPSNDLESQIGVIWQETLQLDRVGVNDNFFDLGGHSLLIVRVHQKIKDVVPKGVSLTDLYQYPTVASLANFLTSDDGVKGAKQASARGARRRKRLGLRKKSNIN